MEYSNGSLFLLLSNNPDRLFIPQPRGIWVVYSFRELQVKLLEMFMYGLLYKYRFSVYWGKFLGVCFQGLMVNLHLSL